MDLSSGESTSTAIFYSIHSNLSANRASNQSNNPFPIPRPTLTVASLEADRCAVVVLLASTTGALPTVNRSLVCTPAKHCAADKKLTQATLANTVDFCMGPSNCFVIEDCTMRIDGVGGKTAPVRLLCGKSCGQRRARKRCGEDDVMARFIALSQRAQCIAPLRILGPIKNNLLLTGQRIAEHSFTIYKIHAFPNTLKRHLRSKSAACHPQLNTYSNFLLTSIEVRHRISSQCDLDCSLRY
jgi:hypothetical protein